MGQFVAPIECAERMGQVMKILEGNGEPGLVADVRKIREDLAAMRGADDERQKEAKRQNDLHTNALAEINTKVARKSLSWAIAGVAATVAGLAIAALAIIVSVYVAQHSKMDPRELLHQKGEIFTVSNQQDSINNEGDRPWQMNQ